jgi:hypothetical protein
MAADRATTAADPACILVAVIISVTMAAITVVAVITGVVVTTVVVVIEYLSSARLSVTQADRDIPVRFFSIVIRFGPPPKSEWVQAIYAGGRRKYCPH